MILKHGHKGTSSVSEILKKTQKTNVQKSPNFLGASNNK